jgi:hypothetical protein
MTKPKVGPFNKHFPVVHNLVPDHYFRGDFRRFRDYLILERFYRLILRLIVEIGQDNLSRIFPYPGSSVWIVDGIKMRWCRSPLMTRGRGALKRNSTYLARYIRGR